MKPSPGRLIDLAILFRSLLLGSNLQKESVARDVMAFL
jgi:hypothetical protein